MLKVYSANDIDNYLIIDEYNQIETFCFYLASEKKQYFYVAKISDDFEESTITVSLNCLNDDAENEKLKNREYRTETAFLLEFCKQNVFENYNCYDMQQLNRKRVAERSFSENNDFFNDEYRNAIKRAKTARIFENR